MAGSVRRPWRDFCGSKRMQRVQLSYEDSTGKRVKASRRSMAAVQKILDQYPPPRTNPVQVVWENTQIPDGDIELEDGGTWNRRDRLPFGYHTLDGETLLIHAPRKAFAPRRGWGIFVPLHAVPPSGGDLSDLEAYLDWVRELGGNIVGTLPLLAAVPGERSPYSPSSRLSWRYEGMERLAEKGGLYLDFPLGVNPNGDDAQKYPDIFAKGVSVGAPPDSFFTKGQNWGFPPFHPEALRASKYDYFRKAIVHHARHADILRIDHVMGLHRLFWIPEGMEAKDGVYVRYDDEELYAIVVLESNRHRCAIVGEDLGTVPEYVPKAMLRHGLRRMYVVQYEAKPERPPLPEPPRMAVASVNTHDMPTFAGFWSGKDIDDRIEQDLLSETDAEQERAARQTIREEITRQVGDGDVLENILTFLARSPAEVVLVNLEDLWGETEPQNVPGLPERSWRQIFRLSLDEAKRDERVRRILRSVAEARGLLSSAVGQ
jgi:4-alpha-glucanotransferase